MSKRPIDHLLYDRRILERNLRQGLLSLNELKQYLHGLPDAVALIDTDEDDEPVDPAELN